jgi:hypothetical protein
MILQFIQPQTSSIFIDLPQDFEKIPFFVDFEFNLIKSLA